VGQLSIPHFGTDRVNLSIQFLEKEIQRSPFWPIRLDDGPELLQVAFGTDDLFGYITFFDKKDYFLIYSLGIG